MKNTDMLEWMNDLDAKYLTEAAEPAVRQHRRHRLFPALTAAAIAAVCMAAGVSAYGIYHKESVQKYFGISGEESASAYVQPQTAQFSNGRVNFTVDTLLFDGHSAEVVVTLESLDPAVTFPHDDGYMPEILCNADWEPIERDVNRLTPDGKKLTGYGCYAFYHDADLPSNLCRYVMEFQNMEDWIGETLYFRFAEKGDPEYYNVNPCSARALLDGLRIELPMEPNCTAYTMTAEDGSTLLLSDFELLLPPENEIDWDHFTENAVTLIGADGTEQTVSFYSACSADDGTPVSVKLAVFDENESVTAPVTRIFSAEQTAAIRLNGVTYQKQ